MELKDKQQYNIVLYNGERKNATYYKKYWRWQPPIQKKWIIFETEQINCFITSESTIIKLSEIEFIFIDGIPYKTDNLIK
ncbi:hypothetical protein [Dysgonomonas termitidis]|uniref:hypothetical protein n=1 Tax=Dysgonomonas termitidis TaxID=1516126 RepID=UPI0036D209FA